MHTHAACRLWKYCCSGDRLARLVQRGISGSPRVKVQQERVVVGATRYNLSIFSLLLLSCLCSVWCMMEWCVFSSGRIAILSFGCAWPTTDAILGSGRRRPTIKRGRCRTRLHVYFLDICYFTHTKYRRAWKLLLRAVPTPSRRPFLILFLLSRPSTYKLTFWAVYPESKCDRDRDASKDTNTTRAQSTHRFCSSSTQLA